MRAIWKGAISFGLVHIPVKLYAATERKDIKFRFLHSACHTPIQYQRHCPYCDRDVPDEEIIRGYEYETGRFVIVSDADLEGISREAGRSIDILDFVDLSEIDPIFYDKTYYLEAAELGLKAYKLLFQAMEETGKVALARVVIRSKDALATIRPFREGLLVLETMFYPDEVRQATELIGFKADVDIHENELKMAKTLINNLTAPFEPQKYTNEYRKALVDLIRARVAGEEVEQAPQPAPAANVIDIMDALKASIEATAQTDTKQQSKPRKVKVDGSRTKRREVVPEVKKRQA